MGKGEIHEVLNDVQIGRLRSGVAVVMVGSTFAQDAAIPICGKESNQRVTLGDTATPILRRAYDVSATSPGWSDTGKDVNAAPYEPRSLNNGFSGSFTFEAIARDRSELSSRITESNEQLDAEDGRPYECFSAALNDPAVDRLVSSNTTLGIFSSRIPENTIDYLPIDRHRWEVSGAVASSNKDIGSSGPFAPNPETVVTKDVQPERVSKWLSIDYLKTPRRWEFLLLFFDVPVPDANNSFSSFRSQDALSGF